MLIGWPMVQLLILCVFRHFVLLLSAISFWKLARLAPNIGGIALLSLHLFDILHGIGLTHVTFGG